MPETSSYSLDDLLYLMRRLRDPESGCPWDLKQSFETIAPYTLEEVYEVVDTIERHDYKHLSEELGDLLFQVVFYSQLGEESELFGFQNIVDTLCDKLIMRHPHVFPEGDLSTRRSSDKEPEEKTIKQTWESIKQAERQNKGRNNILDDIPKALPALIRAKKLQKRAANHGFDWPDESGVLDKMHEEIDELSQAVAGGDLRDVEEEMGDLLFTCVNLARHLGIDSETALRRSNNKFQQRFEHMEQQLATVNREFSCLPPDEMEVLWKKAKIDLNKEP